MTTNCSFVLCLLLAIRETGVERRQIMKDKIVAMGRIARVVRFVGVHGTALSPFAFPSFPVKIEF
jgi:hypothetical protein